MTSEWWDDDVHEGYELSIHILPMTSTCTKFCEMNAEVGVFRKS